MKKSTYYNYKELLEKANTIYCVRVVSRAKKLKMNKQEQIEQARKETAKVILYMLYDMGIDKETLECCRIFDVNGVSLAKQICEKYDVEIEK